MLVSVTGGTGFVGAHSVAAVLRAGHRVRLLVRDESTVERALGPLRVDTGAVEVVTGNVLDRISVARLVRGTDAVLHAASVYSFDSRAHREMARTNVTGTEQVLDAARRAGVARIVYVSSFGALLPSPGRVLGPDSPVGRPREAYLAAKAAAESVARAHQEAGAPVTITYPPALLGPHDPKMGDEVTRLRNALRGLMPIWPTGGLPVGDVRDTAALHAALLAGEGPGGNRHFGPGHHLTTRQIRGDVARGHRPGAADGVSARARHAAAGRGRRRGPAGVAVAHPRRVRRDLHVRLRGALRRRRRWERYPVDGGDLRRHRSLAARRRAPLGPRRGSWRLIRSLSSGDSIP